ncbi:hypothetical protein SKAU_G00242850 [Synaphobranchus kaupii]|uniref:ZP domain-containing protein n=1 Tax=Synaphobranchus kaupii TaxID=118154 RepID=A0A9Q1IUE4_SYNKA|nr:hypothetical protein SKAU_G00242850 [Synaphobranchus kaupii]
MIMHQSFQNQSGELTIEWTPTEREVGDDVPLCFSGESNNGGNYYHSEMRCVILRVGPKIGEANVVCTQTTMMIEAERSLVHGLDVNALSLLDSTCMVSSNDTHVFASTALDSCGTVLQEGNDNVTFINKIVKAQNPGDIITRTDDVEVEFSCSYRKKDIVSSDFKAHKLATLFMEEGFGKFSFQFEFFHSHHYNIRVDPSSYPIEILTQGVLKGASNKRVLVRDLWLDRRSDTTSCRALCALRGAQMMKVNI